MKIKVIDKSWEEVQKLPKPEHKNPTHQKAIFRWLLKTLSAKECKDVHFTCNCRMDGIDAKEPCLFLMNHSSFTDLQIASQMLADREFHIVCTNDGFIGKEGLMRAIGCIPTKKFISDPTLVRDMKYMTEKLGSSILMFPEASYSFDGTETPLPASLGKCLKFLKVPVIMIRTRGAFLRDPLYNNLQKRKADVQAEMYCLLRPEEIAEKSVDELNEILAEAFRYDHFREQAENGVRITEAFRADGLHRALYKCPHCQQEGCMTGAGTTISCRKCGVVYTLNEFGKLEPKQKSFSTPLSKASVESLSQTAVSEQGVKGGAFEYVPDWYAWERACVRKELESGEYRMDLEVDILVLADMKSMYRVGSGRLIHDQSGFTLTGCDGTLNYKQSPAASYSLYADYFWYEIGDMISIGDSRRQFYCFPKNQEEAIVAKARLAAEELYNMQRRV